MSLLRFSRVLLSAPRTHVLQVLSKPDCCLCDQAAFAISRLLTNLGDQARHITLKKTDISSNPDLMDKFSLSIPVVTLDDEIVSEGRFDLPRIHAALKVKLRAV